jgi:hypothetical protein
MWTLAARDALVMLVGAVLLAMALTVALMVLAGGPSG